MAEVVEDFNALRLRQLTVRQAAEQMGMSHGALDQALHRARRAGLHIVEALRGPNDHAHT